MDVKLEDLYRRARKSVLVAILTCDYFITGVLTPQHHFSLNDHQLGSPLQRSSLHYITLRRFLHSG